MSPSLATGLLGVVLGMRHALEPDHLAAVSTLATQQRSGREGLWLGVVWGLGHSFSLLVVGGTLALVGEQMPPAVTASFEVAVAVVIIALGVAALRRSFIEGTTGTHSTHSHGEVEHSHPGAMEHLHLSGWTLSTRPLLVGILHGLAGTGALTALVIAELPTFGARFAYLAVFSLGTMLGMALVTGLAGVPMMRLARAPRVAAGLLSLAGVFSIVIGVWWAAQSVRSLLE